MYNNVEYQHKMLMPYERWTRCRLCDERCVASAFRDTSCPRCGVTTYE